MWNGDYSFLLSNLIQKDFKIRYRNMSLGIFWSLLNPLVTMGVLTLVFTIFYPTNQKNFPLFALCGLIPFNFFTLAWSTGTSSLIDNATVIKRIAVPREVIPIATVLANCLHLLIQIGLLIAIAIFSGAGVNRHWAWLPLIWVLEIAFVCGLALITSAVNIYIRDTRYVVESFNAVLFWLVPIFYPFSRIQDKYREVVLLNPIAAVVMALRNIMLEDTSPAWSLLIKLSCVSCFMLALGFAIFHWLKHDFYDYL